MKKYLRFIILTMFFIPPSCDRGEEHSIIKPPGFKEDPKEESSPIVLDGAVTKTICPGVEWTSFHGLWGGEMRNINIVKTILDEHNSLGIFFDYSHTGLDNLDEKCELMDAVAGTNGPAACCNFVRVNGAVKREANKQEDYWIVNCALTIDGNVVDIVKVKDNFAARELPNKTVGCAGPLLVWEGEIQKYPEEGSAAYLKNTHPRTAIGISKDGKTVFQVAVDGRYDASDATKRAIGMSSQLLSMFMKGLGCYKAMNFDGGGGTAMWVYGEGDGGIVNHPCDNSDWDHPQASLRATGNAVYVRCNLK